MKVWLFQLDGKLPNMAIMRMAAEHRDRGDKVTVWKGVNPVLYQSRLDEGDADLVYGSLIFQRTRSLADQLKRRFPKAVIGGTGSDNVMTLKEIGVPERGRLDYADYPKFRASLGFTQRGCRLRCGFCVVPSKEGAVSPENRIGDIWRGAPWPKHLLLLDNDFFGQELWRDRIKELRDGKFKVSFNQGINARMLTEETAEAIASVDYRDDGMKVKRIYTAWDNQKDEARLFRGLEALVRHGVKPAHIMVYMLVGYWPGETQADREYRRYQLREFGAVPYPMPYKRTPELMGFQRWVIGAYDKRIKWSDWVRASYRPEHLDLDGGVFEFLRDDLPGGAA